MKFEKAPFKLTREMIDIMGGCPNAEPFKIFKHLCVQGYLALRHHSSLILHLTSLMIESGLPCFKRKSMRNLRRRFRLDQSALEAGLFMEEQIDSAYNALSTRLYDVVQSIQQGIVH